MSKRYHYTTIEVRHDELDKELNRQPQWGYRFVRILSRRLEHPFGHVLVKALLEAEA